MLKYSCLALITAAAIGGVLAACGGSDPVDHPIPGPGDDAGPQADAGQDGDARDGGHACGNGVVEPGEECDLGAHGGVGCSARCEVSPAVELASWGVSFAPRVAASPSGDVIAWPLEDYDKYDQPDGHQMRARLIDLSGAPAGLEQRIDALGFAGSRGYDPDVRLTGGPDGFLASWYHDNGGGLDGDLHVRKLDALGRPTGKQELPLGGPAAMLSAFELAAHAGTNDFTVAYGGFDSGAKEEIQLAQVSSDGVPAKPAASPAIALDSSQDLWDITAAPASNGGVLLVWFESDHPAGTNQSLFLLRAALQRGGAIVWQKTIHETNASPNFAMAASGDGSFFVTWTDWDERGDILLGEMVSEDGTQGPLLEIDSRGGTPGHLRIAYSPKGEFLVVWEDAPRDPWLYSDPWSIRGRRYTAAGAPIDSAAFLVDAAGTGGQSRPDVAANPDGSYLVAFSARVAQKAFALRYRWLPPGFRLPTSR